MADIRTDDLRILEHARRWLPYGGGTDNVLADLIEGPAGQQLPCEVRNGLRRQVVTARGVLAESHRVVHDTR